MQRRELLRAIASAALARALLGCGDDLGEPAASFASAILEPTSSAVLVVAWAREVRAVRVVVTAGAEVVWSCRLVIGTSGSAAVDVTGLAADLLHDVVITTEAGVRVAAHRVRTAPPPTAVRPVRIACSADCDPSPAFDNDLLEHLVGEAPELYVSIGDFPYTDNGPRAVTVAAYRERHVELRTSVHVRALLQACGMRAIYDDHEFRNNWDAHWVAAEPARYAAAMQVWDEFFPLRGAPAIKYRSWRWGANLECFLLDCRRYRSADDAPDDGQKTMLGATQRQWLLAGLAASTATFKLVFTSIPLDYGNGNDDWSSFATERQVLFDGLLAAAVPGVLFISGDQHWFAAQTHAYGIREIQTGPLARGLGTPPPAVAGVRFRSVQYNAALVDIDGDSLTVTGLGADGRHFYREVMTAEQLTPRVAR